MANTISSSLQRDVFMEAVLTAFQKALAPISLFSTAFRDVRLEGTDKLQVPYYPLETATSKDFDGTYVFDQGTVTQAKEVTINRRKYQPMSYTSAELARQPKFDPQKLGELKGLKLAEDVLVDILSVVTAANYGSTALSGDNFGAATHIVSAYNAFDMDDVIDLETIADSHHWPLSQRGLIIKPSYLGNVKKDLVDGGGLATFGINPTGEASRFPSVNSFSVAQTTIIPGNSENLVGFAVYPSAILVGFAPVPPAPNVAKLLASYQSYSESNGLTLEVREWGDADSDTDKWTVECNYGYALGEAKALKRIISS